MDGVYETFLLRTKFINGTFELPVFSSCSELKEWNSYCDFNEIYPILPASKLKSLTFYIFPSLLVRKKQKRTAS